MKQLLLVFALLSVTATAASAAGISLRWNACLGDAGVQNLGFACDTNTGSRALVGSFQLASDLAGVHSNELVVDLAAASATLPDWWRFLSAGSCRQLSLSISAYEGTNCPDLFVGKASMNIAAYLVPSGVGPNYARLLSVNAVQQASAVDLPAGQEYGIARWTINNQKTIGTGSCAGCATPVCIVFSSANIISLDHPTGIKLTEPAAPGSNYVTWQGGGGNFCPAATPARNSTWGAVKSLYR
jgi:hypothetical protein